MAIRIKPPHSSVRRLNRFPQNTPIRLPAIERTKEVKPIIAIGERMDMNEFMPTKAKEMPTANASILVATASVNTTFKRVGSKQHLSSLLNPSFIIRPPKKAKRPKAIQLSLIHISEPTRPY